MPSAMSPAGGAKSSQPARYPEAAVLPVFAQSGRNKPPAPVRRELRSEHRGLQIAYFSMGYGDSPASNSAGFYQILPAVPQPGQSRKRMGAVTFGIRLQQLPARERQNSIRRQKSVKGLLGPRPGVMRRTRSQRNRHH
jgi:hypothetical protein